METSPESLQETKLDNTIPTKQIDLKVQDKSDPDKNDIDTDFKCDRKITTIEDKELEQIISLMKGKELSETTFLGPKDDLQEIIDSDQKAMADHHLTKDLILDSFGKLLKKMRESVRNKSERGGDMTTGFVRHIDDSGNKMTAMMKNLFEGGLLEKIRQENRRGVQIINMNDTGAQQWSPGLPDPFVCLPVKNPQWSSSYRRCALVPHQKVPYVVAEIVWNGCQRCPFQDPEDKKYHGYEYGDRDYLIIAPGFDDDVRPRDWIQAISDLSLHMITNHDFWGKGLFRIDPIRFANILGVGPNPIKSAIEVESIPGPSGKFEME